MAARTAVALGLGLLAGGALFGSPSLYPAAVALLLLPPAAIAWVRLAARGARVERRPPRGPLHEGQICSLALGVHGGLLPPPGGELRDPLLESPLPLGPARRSRSYSREISFERRGRHRLGAAELVIRDPFGLAERRLRSEVGGELIVLPRIQPLLFAPRGGGGHALGFGLQGGGGGGPQSWAAEFEIDGLRPYRPGSPAARIHWPTVARTGELHERRITSGADAARLVVLDPQRPASEADLDAAVRAAASICRHLALGAGCTLLIGGEPRPIQIEGRLRNFAHAHHLLALAEAEAGIPATQRIGRAGIVVWVSADPSRSVETRLARVPATRRFLVRPEHGGSAGTALFSVAGCAGRELGSRARRPHSRAAA